jgi:hypothetical protein
MKQQDHTSKQIRPRVTSLGALAAVLLCLGLLSAASASANYEQVDTFAGTPGVLHPSSFTEWPEEVQLGGVGGMAVNRTGAGGVLPGTLYAATEEPGEFVRVARFNPDGSFSENWTFTETPGFKERCGPDGEPAHPVCQSQPSGNGLVDVDVDESTGYVYLFRQSTNTAGKNLIHVYSADGSKLITEFGVKAASGETTAASPEKIHDSPEFGGLAVGVGGKVYVNDENFADQNHRLMVFEPQSPGDNEHYVYAGQGKDVGMGTKANPTISTRMPVTDDVGDIYVVGGARSLIAKLDPSKPADPVLCEFSFPKGHIRSITVNPANGEVFFYVDADKKIHRLASCKEGKFAEAGSFGFSPPRFLLTAMAFNPTGQFEPGRPAGTLYAGTPTGEGGKAEGVFPNSKEEISLGYIFAAPAEFPPEVKSESVEHVTPTTADLGAQINPKGPSTTYAFQYITQADYEANEPADRFAGAAESPPGGALLGEGPDTLSAATSITGLEPDTAYHYRAVATSHCSEGLPEKVCEGIGADQIFHTFAVEAPGLPDKRVYELVSPTQKQGGQVLPADPGITSCGPESSCKPGFGFPHYPMQSRPDGEAIVYEGTPFSGGEGTVQVNQYIARRDAKAGWQSANLSPSQLGGNNTGYKAFDAGLGEGLLSQGSFSLSPDAPAGYPNIYTQPTANPLAFGPLLVAEPPSRLPGESGGLQLTYAGAAADLSRVFFAANDALTGETAFAPEALDGGPAKYNLYEWTKGELALVNVLPGNTGTEPGAAFGALSASAISKDGSHAFWSDEAGQVYVRIGGTETRKIEDPGKFISASTDGSKLLLDDGCLYDLAEEQCEDLTTDESDVHRGGFLGIAGQSDDLSHVYFVDSAALAPGAEARACKKAGGPQREEEEEGKVPTGFGCNLYAWSEGTTRFVATLLADDNENGNLRKTWSRLPSIRTAEASPHGRFLAFQSQAQITGYDDTGPCGTDHMGGFVSFLCPQAFLYDSATGKLSCVSCNLSGSSPLGWSVLRLITSGAGLPQPRYLTDEGRLYFDSRDSLSPFDTNDGAEDVYQYEPEGVGSCERAAGCLSLISAGSEPNDSNFLTMDEDGSNAFFTTRDQLVLKDHDDLIDLYDARQDGGIPAETEVARGECQGEACVAALTPPNDPTPGSSTFEGAGNVDEKKATKKHKKKHSTPRSTKATSARTDEPPSTTAEVPSETPKDTARRRAFTCAACPADGRPGRLWPAARLDLGSGLEQKRHGRHPGLLASRLLHRALRPQARRKRPHRRRGDAKRDRRSATGPDRQPQRGADLSPRGLRRLLAELLTLHPGRRAAGQHLPHRWPGRRPDLQPRAPARGGRRAWLQHRRTPLAAVRLSKER